MSREQVQSLDELNLLLNLVVASARLRTIRMEQTEDASRVFEMRPQLHTIMSGDLGTAKSTAIKQLAKMMGCEPYMSITTPGLVGSIDSDTKEINPGAAWDARHGVLAVDEFNFKDRGGRPPEVLDALLALTENEQYYQKKVGLRNKSHLERDTTNSNLYFKVEAGTIEVRTNFVMMIGTMDRLDFYNQKLKAFISRCLPIRWHPSDDVFTTLLAGQPIYEYRDLLRAPSLDVRVPYTDYRTIIDYVYASNVPREGRLRVIGDCVRAFAILQEHNQAVYDMIIRLKKPR